MTDKSKKGKRLDSTLDQVYASVIVLQLAVTSLSYHTGQASRVKRDIERFKENIVGTKEFEKLGMNLLHEGLNDAFEHMIHKLSSAEIKPTHYPDGTPIDSPPPPDPMDSPTG